MPPLRDWHRHGGILCTFTGSWFKAQVETIQYGVGFRGAVNPNTGDLVAGPETLPDRELVQNRADPLQQALLRELDGPWYRERSADWSRVTVPFLSAGNWGGHGLHLRGNIEAFVQAASKQKWLEIHGLEHWTHFSTNYGLALQKRFFDHFLRLAIQGWDFERETPSGRLGPWERLRGSGPFLHSHSWDRRPEVYGGRITVYGGGVTDSSLLLPIIPGNLH